ncbi:MAG: hypothetical protein ACXW5U_12560 [Thermoanaerobaculia bacterium]
MKDEGDAPSSFRPSSFRLHPSDLPAFPPSSFRLHPSRAYRIAPRFKKPMPRLSVQEACLGGFT